MGSLRQIEQMDMENFAGRFLLSSSDGNIVYKGYWKEDQPHGEGIYYFKNGDIYHGNHDDGDYHGVGKFFTKDGSTYSGEWRQGKRSGDAEYFDANTGVVTVGQWQDNIFVKYESHRTIASARSGHEPTPLKEGYEWTAQRSGEEVSENSHSHHHHDDDCCNHHDHRTPAYDYNTDKHNHNDTLEDENHNFCDHHKHNDELQAGKSDQRNHNYCENDICKHEHRETDNSRHK